VGVSIHRQFFLSKSKGFKQLRMRAQWRQGHVAHGKGEQRDPNVQKFGFCLHDFIDDAVDAIAKRR
jgi:hypothetical protein